MPTERHQEVELTGGTANQGLVVRVGDTVRRPWRPTTPATHALLRHLERGRVRRRATRCSASTTGAARC